jgi:hypothetical protein
MRTKKKPRDTDTEFSGIVSEETRAEVETPQPGPGRERFQLSFDLNPDGSPDLSTMRGKTKEKVQSFFTDPKMAEAFGSRPVTPEVQIFHPAMVASMYAMLGALEAMAVSRIANIPMPICKQVFTYTPAEIEILKEPTVRVLNKYVADWMIKYQDEIALAGLLLSMTVTKVNAAILMARMQGANIPPNGSQVKSEEPPQKSEPGPGTPIQ